MAYKLFVNGNTLPASDLNTAFATSGWTAFTPTIASGTLTVGSGGTLTGYYVQVGKTVHYRITAVFGSSGRALNDPKFDFPVTPNANYVDFYLVGQVHARLSTGNNFMGPCQINGGDIRPLAQSNSSGIVTFTTSSPDTLASGNIISISGFYEAA